MKIWISRDKEKWANPMLVTISKEEPEPKCVTEFEHNWYRSYCYAEKTVETAHVNDMFIILGFRPDFGTCKQYEIEIKEIKQ